MTDLPAEAGSLDGSQLAIVVAQQILDNRLAPLVDSAPDQLRNLAANTVARKLDETIVLLEKQLDYGPGNIANPPGNISPHLALVVRLGDKIQRAGHLLTSGNTPRNEALRDTWLDIANYGTIADLVGQGTWPTLERRADQ